MIDRSHELPLTGRRRRSGSAGAASTTWRGRPRTPISRLMRRIDELHLEHPFAGSRMLRDMLKAEGREVGRRHVSTLMKKMGVEAIYRRPEHLEASARAQDLPIPAPQPGGDAAQPGLGERHHLRADGAGASSTSSRSIDWFSRKVLAWRLSITLSADFCVEALEEALARHGTPEIFNTDQGSQFTSTDFTKVLKTAEDRDQHGRQGRLARQRLRRAALADRSSTRRSTSEPTPASRKPAPRSAGI